LNAPKRILNIKLTLSALLETGSSDEWALRKMQRKRANQTFPRRVVSTQLREVFFILKLSSLDLLLQHDWVSLPKIWNNQKTKKYRIMKTTNDH
jgi:hypothetical protein